MRTQLKFVYVVDEEEEEGEESEECELDGVVLPTVVQLLPIPSLLTSLNDTKWTNDKRKRERRGKGRGREREEEEERERE